MKTAIELIAEERQRQIEAEGWTPEHDDAHEEQELAGAAACYAMPAGRRELATETIDMYDEAVLDYPLDWPWSREWWKPTPNDRIRELVKAGALIVAEIERLQRLEATHE